MIVRAKRIDSSGVLKMAAGGEIKEVILNENLENLSEGGIQICFRGEKSSGVVELTEEEANDLHKTLSSKLKLVKKTKVFMEKA